MLLNIITITKDDFDGLKRTIESTQALRSQYGVRQIIVDSSNNGTDKLIADYLENEINIEYFWQNPSGRSAAFNFGLKNANSEWVWFLNGGDAVDPGLDKDFFLKLLSRNSSDAIIFKVNYSQSKIETKHPSMWELWPPLLSWIPHPATITRRDLYEIYGYYNEKIEIAMDYEFWLRCFSKKVIVDLVSVPIAVFDESGVSKKSVMETKKEVRKIIYRYFWTIIKIWFINFLIIFKALKSTSKFSKS